MSVVRVPTLDEEDRRRLHRERERRIKERGPHSACLKSLLVAHGVRLEVRSDFLQQLETAKGGMGYELGSDLKAEIRRELGACAGLTPTPYSSGESEREQGISKAGNRRIRSMMVELSWLWLRYQPDSALSRWFQERFGGGGKRMRRIGIVAMARKLLIALWRYINEGVIPEGAVLKPL